MATADKFRTDLSTDVDRERVMARLMEKIHKREDGCWEWTGWKNAFGYGHMSVKSRNWVVPRLMVILTKGPIPPKQYVCHTCDFTTCCNPDHLFVGTMSDNIKDCLAKGRNHHKNLTHCAHGHELAGDNVRLWPTPFGGFARKCAQCERAKDRKKLGWPQHLWYVPNVPAGYRMDRATGTIQPCRQTTRTGSST